MVGSGPVSTIGPLVDNSSASGQGRVPFYHDIMPVYEILNIGTVCNMCCVAALAKLREL